VDPSTDCVEASILVDDLHLQDGGKTASITMILDNNRRVA
jgi:hypothetical protein